MTQTLLQRTTAALVTPPTLAYDYSLVADEYARATMMDATAAIKPRLKRATEDIYTIGERLLAVRDHVPHGQWGPWLETEFDMSESTARRFIAVADRFRDKSVNLADLSPSIVYMLAAPSTPDAVVETVVKKAKTGKITYVEAKEIIEEAKPEPKPVYETKPPTKRESVEIAYAWLTEYKDDFGRTWQTADDNQIHHASSTCSNAFRRTYPTIADPKHALRTALARLREEEKDNQPKPTPLPLTGNQFSLLREAIRAWSFDIADKHPPVWHLTMALRPQTTIHDNMLHYLATHEIVVGSAEYIEHATRDVLNSMPEDATVVLPTPAQPPRGFVTEPRAWPPPNPAPAVTPDPQLTVAEMEQILWGWLHETWPDASPKHLAEHMFSTTLERYKRLVPYGRHLAYDVLNQAKRAVHDRLKAVTPLTEAKRASVTDNQISDLYVAVHNAVVYLNREGQLETADALGWGSLRSLLADLITARDAIKRECGRREKVPA